jgi:hypothetical protein
MHYVPLVEDQIEDGRRLMARLVAEGFKVTAASWIWDSEDGQWYLFLASPVVDHEGEIKAYRRVHLLMGQMPQPFSLHPLDVKVIEKADPITKDVVAFRDRYAGRSPTWFRGTRLGELAIEAAAYVYPPVTAASPSAAPGGGG